MTDSNQLATLSPAMRSCIERFSDQGWRERKFATEELVRLVTHEQPDGATMEALIDVLLDLVLEPASVSARAAGQEALVALGRTTVPRILSRLDRADPRSRLLVDLLGSVGTERDVRVLAEIALDPELDENMRASAATALGSLGGSEAIGALENLLDETTEMLTLYALDGLRSAQTRLVQQAKMASLAPCQALLLDVPKAKLNGAVAIRLRLFNLSYVARPSLDQSRR